MIVQPIHTAAVGVANVRFFWPPLPGPRQPWCSRGDLLRASAIPQRMYRHFDAVLQRDACDSHRMVMTPDGRTALVAHPIAQGFVDAMEEVGQVPAGFVSSFTHGAADAMRALTSELGLTGHAVLEFAVAAFRHDNGFESDEARL